MYRMPVDHAANVGTASVHLGVEHSLQVHVVRAFKITVDREAENVPRAHLRERDALSLDPHHALLVVSPRADVSEREILVSVGREDAAGPRHLCREWIRTHL